MSINRHNATLHAKTLRLPPVIGLHHGSRCVVALQAETVSQVLVGGTAFYTDSVSLCYFGPEAQPEVALMVSPTRYWHFHCKV